MMKKFIICSISLLVATIFLASCRKEDNPKLPGLIRFPLPQVLKVAGSDLAISAQNPATFSGRFTVGLYFPEDVPPQKFDVVVMKNENKANIKTLQANVTTFPTELTVTGPQLETLFGEPILVGDKFDISVNVTTADGTTYQAFPVTGNPYASGIQAQPNASTFIRYEAVCNYDPNQFSGNFEVVLDEWNDYPVGGTVPLTMIDATHFSFKYAAENPLPIIVTVNPVTNAVTVAKQVYGSGYPPGWTYGDISVESVPSPLNAVSPCTGTFSVRLKHTVAAGTIGEFTITLRKE